MRPPSLTRLSSPCAQSEHVNLELKGITFTPEDRVDLANAQWFSQLTLMANKVPVLNVSRGDDGFGAMLVEIDGKRQRWEDKLLKADGSFYSKTAFRTFYSKKSMLTATIREGKAHVDDKHAQVSPRPAHGLQRQPPSDPDPCVHYHACPVCPARCSTWKRQASSSRSRRDRRSNSCRTRTLRWRTATST